MKKSAIYQFGSGFGTTVIGFGKDIAANAEGVAILLAAGAGFAGAVSVATRGIAFPAFLDKKFVNLALGGGIVSGLIGIMKRRGR